MRDCYGNLSSEIRREIEHFRAGLDDSKQVAFNNIIENILLENKNNTDLAHKTKKQKVDNVSFNSTSKTTLFQLINCSVLSPIRKKLNFAISFDLQNKYNNIILSDKADEVQFQIENTKQNIKFALFLPVIERSNLSYLLIKYDDDKDPLVLSLNKSEVIKQLLSLKKIESDEDATVNEQFQNCVDYIRKQAILTGFKILDPFNLKNELQSSFLVNSHISSKEGTLYFLPDHLLFGIKKPILILPIYSIKSINYSTITRLTFSLTLILEDDSKIEFSMIDQQEYDKINNYIITKHVNDKSLSDELKAKANAKQEAKGDLTAAIKEDKERGIEQEEDGSDIIKDEDNDEDDSDDADYEADIDNIDGSEDSSDEEGRDVKAGQLDAEQQIQEIEMASADDEVPGEEDEVPEEEDSGIDYD